MESNKVGGKIVDFKVLRRLFVFVKPYLKTFYFLIFLTLLVAFLVPIRPVIVQYTIDNHVTKADSQGLLNMVILMTVLLVVQAILQYFHTYMSGWLGQFIIRDIRTDLYSHLLRLRLKFFDKTQIGRLVTRTISDVETLADVFSQGMAAMISDLLQLVFILAIMFYMDWRLALVSLATFPLLVITTYIFKEKIKVSFNEVRNAVANLNSFVQEHITGMSIVQIFNSEKSEMDKFKKINEEHKRANIKAVLYYSVYFPVAEVISAAGIGLLVWYGARGVINFEETGIQVGTLIAFIMYIQMFFRPIRMIADRFNTLQMGIVSSSRIMKLLDSDEYIDDQGSNKIKDLKGAVSFEKVWFAYEDRNYVLKDISFEVTPGEKVAFVGATGAGKSTIINLINRFYDINRGRILVDGVEIKQYELQDLRKNVGVVMQDVFLFSDTIEYNISLGNKSISRERILETAAMIGADRFINKLPGGLDYNVMERGATLSVGQRQMISFLRAMVYDPKIIILDEATSSVDTETEEMIQESIHKILEGRTSIIIAHRLSTIQEADTIMVMDHGEIKERGNHEELLALNGLYSRLHQIQYRSAV